jgi:hypothetical protein
MATVCEWFGLKTTQTIFVSLALKPVTTVFAGLASKPVATVFSSLAPKLVVMVSPDLASKPVVDFLVEPQNEGGGGFPDLGLKTSRFGLVIWVSKSPQWFLGLVCRLHLKIDREMSAWDMRRDLAACFM